MKATYISALLIMILPIQILAQNFSNGLNFNQTINDSRLGNGTLTSMYRNYNCGLDFVQGTKKITNRILLGPDSVLPVTIPITGIPVNAQIEQAYAWWAISGTDAVGFIEVTNPSNNVQTYNGSIVGTCEDKCWSAGATKNFRADITPSISGDGLYTIDITNGLYATDGVTLFIIFTNPAANYDGILMIDDGCIVKIGGAQSNTYMGFTVCDNPSDASGFQVISDMQLTSHTLTVNGTPISFPSEFMNFDQVDVTLNSGQQTMSFLTDGTNDCFNILAQGFYYRNMPCDSCDPQFTGINEKFKNPEINIFPNPVSSVLSVSVDGLHSNYMELVISDIFGNIVYSDKKYLSNGAGTENMDVSFLKPALYNLQLRTSSATFNKKILLIK